MAESKADEIVDDDENFETKSNAEVELDATSVKQTSRKIQQNAFEAPDGEWNAPDIPPLANSVTVQPGTSQDVNKPVGKTVYLDARKLLIASAKRRFGAKRERNKKRCCMLSLSCLKKLTCVLITTILFLGYAGGGAYLFSTLESYGEVDQSNKVDKWKNDTAILLATELRLVKPYEQIWSKTVFRYLDAFEKDLLKASAMGYRRKDDPHRGQLWTFNRALFFSISLMTTTGMGSNVPKSEWNEAIVMGYTFCGLLVTVTWLIVIGSNMAAVWWWIFRSFCCPLCNGNDSPRIHPHHSQLQLDLVFVDTNGIADFMVAILFPLLILLIYFISGCAFLTFLEDWTVSQSFYFNFVMFVTLGPGCQETNVSLQTHNIRQNIYYVAYWLFGLCLISTFLNLIYLLHMSRTYNRTMRRPLTASSSRSVRLDKRHIDCTSSTNSTSIPNTSNQQP